MIQELYVLGIGNISCTAVHNYPRCCMKDRSYGKKQQTVELFLSKKHVEYIDFAYTRSSATDMAL